MDLYNKWCWTQTRYKRRDKLEKLCITTHLNNKEIKCRELQVTFDVPEDTRSIENMLHWREAAQMVEHIYLLVGNDHI